MTRRTSSIAAVALLFVASCGDDGKSDQQMADEVIALLESELEDDGFTEAEDDGDDSGELEFQSAECQELEEAFGDSDELPGQTASTDLAGDGTFDRGDLEEDGVEETVDASVGFVEDADEIDRVLEPFGGDQMTTCLEEGMQAAFEEEPAPGEIATELVGLEVESTRSDIGDAGYEVSVDGNLVAGQFTIPIAFDFVLARVDRSGVFVFTGTVGTGEASADASEIASQLAGDVEEQLA
jgi:hypothetical protein